MKDSEHNDWLMFEPRRTPYLSAAPCKSACRYSNDIVWQGTIPVMTFSLQIGYLMYCEGGPPGFSFGSEWT